MIGNWMSQGTLLAQVKGGTGSGMPGGGAAYNAWEILLAHLVSGLAFSVVGLLVFLGALWVLARLSPFPIIREIEEDQNTALAIIVGSLLIGMAIIIASAIQG